jgi:hypothetical protein
MSDVLVVPMRVGDTTVQVRIKQSSQQAATTEERVRGGAVMDFADVAHAIEQLCSQLGSVLAKVAPTKAAVEFNVGITATTGKLTALFLEGEADASIKVSLEWAADKKALPTT